MTAVYRVQTCPNLKKTRDMAVVIGEQRTESTRAIMRSGKQMQTGSCSLYLPL
jgi:hypothetical protein